MKFEKLRQELAKSKEPNVRRRNNDPIGKIESHEKPWGASMVWSLSLSFSFRWAEDGMVVTCEGSYYDSEDGDVPVQSLPVGDGGRNKEAAALCGVLNKIPALRYELCYIEEHRLLGKLFGDRHTFYTREWKNPYGISDDIIPAFVPTEGVKGVKAAMARLGFDCEGITTLTFKRRRDNVYSMLQAEEREGKDVK
ncbi:hypothetical protein [uncultured Selenomonas sp.]|uniref:hypothetical protein n=1 Tax=uncultured Selenomonas sp. TaxID=159275 RepID=UPI0028DC8DD0|nr:hypothetical protein [uncultured Selenomonas sp.]